MDKVEIKTPKDSAAKDLHCVCIVCQKKLEHINSPFNGNAENIPCVSGGVVFRSSGQFGSTILDCGVGIPTGWGNEVQIIICDECLVAKAGIVNTTHNKRAVIERRPFADVAVNWSDYSTFEKMREAENKDGKERFKVFDKLMKDHESRKFRQSKKVKKK